MKMENLKQVSIKTGLQAIVFRNKLLHVFILFEYLIAKCQTWFGKLSENPTFNLLLAPQVALIALVRHYISSSQFLMYLLAPK